MRGGLERPAEGVSGAEIRLDRRVNKESGCHASLFYFCHPEAKVLSPVTAARDVTHSVGSYAQFYLPFAVILTCTVNA